MQEIERGKQLQDAKYGVWVAMANRDDKRECSYPGQRISRESGIMCGVSAGSNDSRIGEREKVRKVIGVRVRVWCENLTNTRLK